MDTADSGQATKRSPPDLSFLERSPPLKPGIPELTPATRTPPADNRVRHGDGRVLTIGSGITVSGAINACDSLVVEGTVEADLSAGRSLEVSRGGTFRGRADVDNATIAGTFEGELTVHGRLKIAATGQLNGTVQYSKLEIENGGTLNGTVGTVATVG
tara:strand:- start:648 stop:1121 length:474 start_codon:yes stop_codon:yes gene_type:complete